MQLAVLQDDLGGSSYDVQAGGSSFLESCGTCDVVFGGHTLDDRGPEIGFGVGALQLAFRPGSDLTFVEPTFDLVASSGSESNGSAIGVLVRIVTPDRIFDPDPKTPEDPAPVPEPATLILTGLGLAGVVARRRKRGGQA